MKKKISFKLGKSNAGKVTTAACYNALERARALISIGVEPTSALKDAGSDEGIAWGEDMKNFVNWGLKNL